MIWVANIGGRDPHIDYQETPEALLPSYNGHPPVNFHAYAAATKGTFSNRALTATDRDHQVAVLLLTKRLKEIDSAIDSIKALGKPVWVSWKECGRHQILNTLNSPKRISLYKQIIAKADRVIHTSLDAPPLCPSPSTQIPTPYPVGMPEWNHSLPISERSGIFIGTREFRTASRNHLLSISYALDLAGKTDTHVTVINRDKKDGDKILHTAFETHLKSGRLRVINGGLPYTDYLKLISQHRIVFQWDRSGVPGQVAGDCLLCGTICIGGDSLIEKIAFPFDHTQTLATTERLLTDDSFLAEQIEISQSIGLEQLSFSHFEESYLTT